MVLTAGGDPGACVSVSVCVSVSLCQAKRGVERATRRAHYKPIKVETHTASELHVWDFCAATCCDCKCKVCMYIKAGQPQPQPELTVRPRDVQLHGWVRLLFQRKEEEGGTVKSPALAGSHVLCQPCERSAK